MVDAMIVAGLLLLAMLVCVIASMRAGMFWCPKCKTYHYKSVAPTRCYRDWAERESRKRDRRLDAIHRR
jgi:hypothetical protein